MTKRLFIVFSSILVLAFAGCLQKDQFSLAFSHVLHVKDNGIECDACHGELKEGRFAKPDHKACGECHGDMIKTNEISLKTCGYCHKQKNLNELPKYARTAVVTNGVFTHTASLKKNCADCHDGVLAAGLKTVPQISRAEKLRIRQKAHESAKSCDNCHVAMDPLVRPASHGKAWQQRHGAAADSSGAVCGVCHNEQTCRECHENTKPSSHNNLWRIKTHGVNAGWDRAKCQLCHEEDSCKGCHDEVRPRSHNANWKQRHCDKCHSSEVIGGGCGTCHEADISTHPNPHGAGWLSQHCTKCHDGSPEGSQCVLCHKDGLETHPDPHGTGWLAQHCSRCHSGTPEGEQCALCHASAVESHPNPHAAGWKNKHCSSCHPGTPLGDQCVLCHQGGLGAHPDPHGAGGLNVANHCNTCHVGTPEYEQCLLCHQGGVAAHPDPHGAGGLNVANHCTTCHVGTPEYERCLVCHTGIAGHINPHPASHLNSHCLSCHAGGAGAQGCSECHQGGTSVTVHDTVWPSSHTTSGYGDQTDCFVSGCHDPSGSVDGKRRKLKMLFNKKFGLPRK